MEKSITLLESSITDDPPFNAVLVDMCVLLFYLLINHSLFWKVKFKNINLSWTLNISWYIYTLRFSCVDFYIIRTHGLSINFIYIYIYWGLLRDLGDIDIVKDILEFICDYLDCVLYHLLQLLLHRLTFSLLKFLIFSLDLLELFVLLKV